MATSLQLSIPNACHEDWHSMTAAEKGRFCMSCQKNVIDFTNMSDRKILEHISNNTGRVCGRLHPDQLNRNLTMRKETRSPWLKYFFQFTLPAFFVSMKVQAQDCKKPYIEQTYRQKQLKNSTSEAQAAVVDNELAIRGTVIDENNNPIAGASIIIKGSNVGSVTNAQGIFKIPFSTEEETTLSISMVGYMTMEMRAKPSREPMMVTLKISEMMQGDIVIVGIIRRKPVKRSALEIARSIIAPDSVRIFPNPVGLGNDIDMELTVNKPGNYYVEVTDFNGRLMIKQEVPVNAKVFKSSIGAKQLLAGRYIVCVRNIEGKKIGVKKIIVQ